MLREDLEGILDRVLETDPDFKKIYKIELARSTLQIIVDCSKDDPSMETIYEFAAECLKELNK